MSHHFLFVAIPDRGHVFPNLSVVSELIRRGHRVTFLTGESMAEVITPSGATLLPYDSKYEQVDVLGTTNADPASMPLTLTEDSGAMVRAALAGLADDVPDMIIGDSVTPLAWRILGEKWQRPAVQSSVVFVSNEHWSFVRSMIEDGKITAPPDMSSVFAAMAAVVASSGIEKPPTAFLQPSANEFTLVYLPRAFQFAGDTFSESQFAFVGPSMEDRPFLGEWQPPAGDRPVVLVSLGTTFNRNPDFFSGAAAAFADEPWHVVMTVGGGIDPAEIGPLPSNVEIHQWLPHLEVLERASVFVTHGGVGSVMESLYTGTPMVAIPLTPVDVPTAKRIRELGVGATLTPDTLSAETLRDMVAEVAGDEEILANTRVMQKHVRESGGAREAADVLEKRLVG
jgi:dTDP-L-oleandrosyltransferase